MKETLITFETAKLAKEKGFNISTIYGFDLDGSELFNILYLTEWNHKKSKVGKIFFSRPTQSLLQKWLRDVHKIRVLIDFETIDDSETAYVCNIVQDLPEGKDRKKDTWDFYNRISSFSMESMTWYNTYEEALETGLQGALKLIEIIKQKL